MKVKIKKKEYQTWLDNQNFDFIYEQYLNLTNRRLLVEMLQSPVNWSTLRNILKQKGYKMLSRKEIVQSPQYRENHRKTMQQVVKRSPEQYLGRYRGRKMKTFTDVDYLGNKCTHLGSWEKLIADLLTQNNIHWVKEQYSFNYTFNNSTHLYYPDFYLPDYNLYIEVKGMVTDKDKAKWRDFPPSESLIVIKGDKLINQLRKGELNITSLLKSKENVKPN